MTNLGLQAAKMAAENKVAEATTNLRNAEAQSAWAKAYLDKAGLEYQARAKAADREMDMRSALDNKALYDAYQRKYLHKTGDPNTIMNFERKYGWYYDPRRESSVQRELAWKDYQTKAADTAGRFIGNVVGAVTGGVANVGKGILNVAQARYKY